MNTIKLTHRNKFRPLSEIKKEYLHKALKEAKLNVTRAAELSGVSIRSMTTFVGENYKRNKNGVLKRVKR